MGAPKEHAMNTNSNSTTLLEFNPRTGFQHLSVGQLCFKKVLFSLMQFPWLTDLGIKFLQQPWAFRIPLVEFAVKHTLFKQFCGGESVADALNVLQYLSSHGVSGILDFAAERGASETEFQASYLAILKTIEAVSQFSGHRFTVFKPTALTSFDLLHKISDGLPLSASEEMAWSNGKKRIESLCEAAVKHDVVIMADAEESWIQPAIDALMQTLMRKHNSLGTHVFTTIQFYRTGRVAELQRLLQDAEAHNYHLGIKAVRGAYLEKEREFAVSNNKPSAVHATKEDTDKHFDQGVEFAMENLHRISLCVATHNEASILSAAKTMQNRDITKTKDKASFSQLYGMSDHVTFCLASAGYHASKYIPYGHVREAVPYLLRRAQENTAVQGQTTREGELISCELSRRFFLH
jgi:proline dehydrogenase